MTCLGYMCEFKDLEVKAVLLSDLMQNPDDPEDGYFFRNDVKVCVYIFFTSYLVFTFYK